VVGCGATCRRGAGRRGERAPEFLRREGARPDVRGLGGFLWFFNLGRARNDVGGQRKGEKGGRKIAPREGDKGIKQLKLKTSYAVEFVSALD